ncbi:spore cortex-lytic enzyme [Clostridia bacterium]|nr:spore cortex-lytic enzyme [Clostridia bacterium]
MRKAFFAMFMAMALIIAVQPAKAATYTWGSSGEAVKTIQQTLKSWGYYTGEVDGKYGLLTLEAVKYFQRRNGLTEDGVVGPKTLEGLGMPGYTPWPGTVSATKAPSATTPPATNTNIQASSRENDIWLLACVINGEGRGESYLGQVAIGAVVMNRVKSPLFPDTVYGVIYQPGAFDAVKDGQINLTPTQSCINAARDAMNGWDPVDGALFYWNPKTATSKWVLSLTITKSIENHVFGMSNA